jgi:hypothetical protein
VKRVLNVAGFPFAGSSHVEDLRRFAMSQAKVQFFDPELRKLSRSGE